MGIANPSAFPPSTNTSGQSGWSYIVDRLIDRPGQTYVTLAHTRPEHLSPRSIEALCYLMAKMGILTREGRGTEALFRVAANGLDKIPSRWRHEGLPGNGQHLRSHGDKSQGFGGVAKLAPEARPALSPLKGKPVELADNIMKTPSGKFIVIPDAPAPPATLKPETIKAAEEAYTEACIVALVGGKPRRFPISVAKSLYQQFKEIFE
jgi:hypothetical protein